MKGKIQIIVGGILLGGAVTFLGIYAWKDSQKDPECVWCKQPIHRDKLLVHQWSCPKNPGKGSK
jgi:hypothetical protein